METIYYNGPILTLEQPLRAQALLARDGVIAAVGTLEAVRRQAGPGARLRDLQGCALLPAFLDPHSHITAYAQTLGLLDLSGAESFDALARRVRAYEAALSPGQWINGFGYDPNALKEGRHPDRAFLDRLSSRPVLLVHASGHMAVANSAALRALGVDAATPDPAGGRIGREADGHTPNGYLEEAAFTAIAAQVPRPTREDSLRLLARAQQKYLSHGITTVQDGLTRQAEYDLLRAAEQAGKLQVDVVYYADEKNWPQLDGFAPKGGRLRMGGYKIILDGSPQGRTAYLSKPYEGEESYRGYPAYEDAAVQALMDRALAEGRQLLAHCNGDAAAEQMIRCYERARARRPGAPDVRPVMIHAQLLRPDQLPAMARLSMIASFFIAHIWHWGDAHVHNLGERAQRISPVGSAIQNGVRYTFHQDSPVLAPDMLETLFCAVNRITARGQTLGESERIPVLDALRGVTVNAAYQYFEEGRKGSLAPGKLADLVILDQDPLSCAPERLRDIRVLETIKEGVTLYTA